MRREITRHPRMTAVDLQKLVYQAVFGIDHLLKYRTCFTERLTKEWESIAPVARVEEEELQTIDPAGVVGRLHLQPCKACGVEIDDLIGCFIAQSPIGGGRERFTRLWSFVCELAGEGEIRFAERSLAALPFPENPSHHSAGYGEASYRVVNDITSLRTAAFIQGLQGGI